MIQLQALNKILKDKNYSFIINNNLSKEFFSDYPDEYSFIMNHYNNYGSLPDLETFLNKFETFDIVDVSEPYDYILDGLYEDLNRRKLAKTFNKVRELINSGKTEEAMTVYLNASEDIVKAKHLSSVDIIEDVTRYDDYVEKCNDFKKFYISTGFAELDNIIGGWDRAEELATIVARPGVGKSWILIKCALAAVSQGLKVGIYSGEMSERKVGYRFDTLSGHISNGSLIHGNSKVQNDYKKYIDELPNKYTGSIRVITPSMINGPAGVNSLRAFVEKENIEILFIDQHSLLEDDRKARTPHERAANISRDLKNLQVMKHIPIIAVSQQNRTAGENGPDTSNVAQSDRISQDSTIVIFLEQKDGILTLNLVKSRDSVNNKKLKYAVDFDKGIFTYIPTELTDDVEVTEDLRQEYDGEFTSGSDEF